MNLATSFVPKLNAIDLNVIEQVKILTQSPLFKKLVTDGSLKILGARYNLQSGKVEILDAGDSNPERCTRLPVAGHCTVGPKRG